MKSELLLEGNKFYKLEPGNILIIFNHLFSPEFLCYYIDNTFIAQLIIDKNLEVFTCIIIDNPTIFYAYHSGIMINDLEINNLLKSEDKTIVNMVITILFDKYNITI